MRVKPPKLEHPMNVSFVLLAAGGIAGLPDVGHPQLVAQEQGVIAIVQVTNAQDKIAFTFTSTWPAGTSYQPQFRQSLNGSWADLPDAHVEPAGSAGGFLVTAPKFGGVSGFYRVANSV